MAATPIYGFRYPVTGDSPHGPDQIKHLAEDVEAKVSAMDAAQVALQASADTQNTVGTTTSGTYTATLTGGTACGVVFVAPPSGKVTIFNNSGMLNSGISYCFCAIQIRTGGSIGSGTLVLTASDDESIYFLGSNDIRHSMSRLMTGLTAGSTYNVQQLFRVTGGTGTFNRKHLVVQPSL